MPKHCHTALPRWSEARGYFRPSDWSIACHSTATQHCRMEGMAALPALNSEKCLAMPRASRARYRAQRAFTCRLAHVDAACACSVGCVIAPARGKAVVLFTTTPRVTHSRGQILFRNLPKASSRAPAPAHHTATSFHATCAAECARTWSASSIARHPPPCMAEHRPSKSTAILFHFFFFQ